MAEATGVFFYVFAGISSAASFTFAIAGADEPITSAFGSLLQIGFSFALGIAFAIITCGPTSGGHFNPAVTLCLAYWQGFPWRKVPYYIFSQTFGAFIAGLMVMGMYRQQFLAYDAALAAKGITSGVFNGGPASIFCSFPGADQSLGYLFFIEWFVDSYIGIVIWATLDPANPFIAPASAPFVVGLSYSAMIWGFADITISTNFARDLGTRCVAAIFYGREAFTYKNYSWISILVNIPATFFATAYYEFLMRDSLQKLAHGAAYHESGDEGLRRVATSRGIIMERGMAQAAASPVNDKGSEY